MSADPSANREIPAGPFRQIPRNRRENPGYFSAHPGGILLAPLVPLPANNARPCDRFAVTPARFFAPGHPAPSPARAPANRIPSRPSPHESDAPLQLSLAIPEAPPTPPDSVLTWKQSRLPNPPP